MKILILFNELSEYIMACVNALAVQSGAGIQIIRLPLNKEAPFKFGYIHPNITLHLRTDFSDNQLVDTCMQLNPDMIICSGWKDKAYLKVCSHFHGKIPTVLIFDNKWRGSLRQHFAAVASPLLIKNKFSHCFVPGAEQKKFAKKLGYPDNKILTGLYACDFKHFSSMYNRAQEAKAREHPKRFLYVGRYLEIKGITDLWEAFVALKKETQTDWELWCAGTGQIPPFESPGIVHLGFVQPAEMESIISQTSVFVMPSHNDAWGVALQEMCAAGMPVLVSNKVGAINSFFVKGKNGFIYPARNKKALKERLLNFTQLSHEQLLGMGAASHDLAATFTPEKWANSLIDLMHVRN